MNETQDTWNWKEENDCSRERETGERETGKQKRKHLKAQAEEIKTAEWLNNLECVCFFDSSDTAYVRIFISDVNDNKPVFSQSAYEVDVDEDADVGSTILTVSANDEDEGRKRWGGAFDDGWNNMLFCNFLWERNAELWVKMSMDFYSYIP